MALGLGDLHPLPGSQSEEVDLKLGNHRQCVEQQLPHRVGRVVHGAADVEFHLACGQFVGDVAGIGHRSSESIEFAHNQDVATATRREGFPQTRAGPVGAGQPMINIDTIRRHTKRGESIPLRREVLRIGGTSGVSDQQLHHDREHNQLAPDHRAFNRAGLLRMRRSRSRRIDGGRSVCVVGVRLAGARFRRRTEHAAITTALLTA